MTNTFSVFGTPEQQNKKFEGRVFSVCVSPALFSDETKSTLQYQISILVDNVVADTDYLETVLGHLSRLSDLETALSNLIMDSFDWFPQFDSETIKIWYLKDGITTRSGQPIKFTVTAINAEESDDLVYETLRGRIYETVWSWLKIK